VICGDVGDSALAVLEDDRKSLRGFRTEPVGRRLSHPVQPDVELLTVRLTTRAWQRCSARVSFCFTVKQNFITQV
jgi:hypothetical protein